MENYLVKVNKNVNIEEGQSAIENILLSVYFSEGASTKELARKNLMPLPLIAAVKREFIKSDILVQDRGVRLTNKGKIYIEDYLGFNGIDRALYGKLLQAPYEGIEEIDEIRKKLEVLFNNRPSADVTIDQSKCTLETAIKRAILCLRYSSLIGKRILCIGDDDMVSLALGFLLKALFKGKSSNTFICVMDIDNRILDYIEAAAFKNNLPIKCLQADFRNGMPDMYRESFDCFFTDPPYTEQGLKLFVSRGVEALKRERALPIFLSYAHKSPEFFLKLQKSLLDMRLTISEILPSFNSYEGADILGNQGQMIVLKTTGESKPLLAGNCQEELYTGDLKKTVRLYKCSKCGEVIKVGCTQQYTTIEELKAKGCHGCANNTFRLIEKIKL